MVPERLLVHDLVIVRPAVGTVDAAYGTVFDYGASAVRSSVRGWLDPPAGTETFADGRDVLEQRWTLITNYLGVDGNDRVEWAGHPAGGTMIFTVDGPPEPAHTPRGRHHLRTRLRKVEG